MSGGKPANLTRVGFVGPASQPSAHHSARTRLDTLILGSPVRPRFFAMPLG